MSFLCRLILKKNHLNPEEIVLLTFVTILDFGNSSEAKLFQQSNFFGKHRHVYFPAVYRPGHRDCADWSFAVIFSYLALPRAIEQHILIEPRITIRIQTNYFISYFHHI